ncbi:MAG: DUF4365 domain-containing protein [Hydrogenophaga sp.]|nr:DUF4365 domain-containing protein [Hydrogenophaga sp.]
MYITHQKESFNAAYVSSVAAHAGLKTTSTSIDDDSVDLMLIGSDFSGLIRNPQLHLQLKCTESPNIVGNILKFPLKIKNYDDLRATNVLSPQYLVVMVVPKPCDDWVVHHVDSMTLHKCCYWASLRGAPATSNTKSVTINVPLSQRLTTFEMKKLATLASNRAWP